MTSAGSAGSGSADPHSVPPGPVARWIAALAALADRFAPWVVIGGVLGATLLLLGPVRRLAIDTDTADMISDRLEWRQRYIAFQAAFPQFTDELAIVIDARTPDLADRARRQLSEALSREPELFPTVYTPGAGPFFRRHALLYLSVADLEELAANVERYRSWIRRLEREPELETLVAVLRASLADARRGNTELELSPILAGLAEAFRARTEWRFHQLSWRELFTGRRAEPRELRAFILVQPRLDYGSLLPGAVPIGRLRSLVHELGLEPARGVRVRLTGEVAMAHEELRTVMRGAGRAGVLALVAVSLILYLGVGSVRVLVASIATLLIGLVATAAFAAFAIGRLNLISIAFAVLFIGLGIDYAIHFCLRYRELGGADEHRTALAGAAVDVGPAIALSAVTTAACFYAFVPTDFVGVSELGLIAGTGMFIGLATTLTLLPALLSLLRPWSGRQAGAGPREPSAAEPRHPEEWNPGPADHALRALRRWGRAIRAAPRRRPRAVLAVAGAVALTSLVLLPGVRFDHNPLNLRDRETESVATYFELLADSTSHPLTLSVLEPSSEAARETAGRLARLEVVESARTLDDLLPDEQPAKRRRIAAIAAALGPPPGRGSGAPGSPAAEPASGSPVAEPAPGSPAAEPASGSATAAVAAVRSLLPSLAGFRPFASPEAAGAARFLGMQVRRWLARVEAVPPAGRAAAVEALEESLVGSLPEAIASLRASLDPGPVGRADLPEELVARWVSRAGFHRVEVLPRENVGRTPALRRFVEEVRAVSPEVTGAPVVEFEAGFAVVRAFRQALILAVLATAGILFFVLRRVAETSYVLAPLLLAGLATAAVTALLGLQFNFANVIALPLLFGVGVDAGIHMLHRARMAPPPDGDLLRTSTARAIVVSALTTVASFGNLALTGHPGTASMGVLLTLGMILLLISTLALLPALLASRAGAPVRPGGP